MELQSKSSVSDEKKSFFFGRFVVAEIKPEHIEQIAKANAAVSQCRSKPMPQLSRSIFPCPWNPDLPVSNKTSQIFNCFFLSFAFSLLPIKSSFSNSSFLWLFVLYLFVLYLLSIYCYIYWICWLVLYLCRDGIIISKYCAVTSKFL